MITTKLQGKAKPGDYRPLPFPIRVLAWVLIIIQVFLPMPPQAIAAVLAKEPSSSSAGSQNLSTEAPVTVNHTIPNVRPPSGTIKFSDIPSDLEFFHAKVFAEPLIPTGATTVAENKALAVALLSFVQRTNN